VDLGGIRDGSTTLAALRAGAAHGLVHVEAEAEGGRIPVRGTFDAWLHAIGDNMRVNLRKARNRLERLHPGGLAFRFLAGADATEAPLEGFAAMEASGWKGEVGGALAASPPKMELYRRLARRFAARGWLEWHFLDVGGKPAAAHMAVRMGRTLVMFRICYDEGLGKFMPGNLLIRESVERAFRDRDTDAIDFVQTQPWQKNWRMETYAYHRARIFARRPLPLLFGALPGRARALARRVPLLRRLARSLRR
jgi:CelD/BcsL family acetyltransferase involved in cellulose biosynthesis